MVAITFVVATIAISCKNKLSNTNEHIDLTSTPSQVVENIIMIQSRNSNIEFRMEASLLERYETESEGSYELFPEGFKVNGYNEEGVLETSIVSDQAKHTNKDGEEMWAAFGNVVIKNFLKEEQMETDTIYWNQKEKKIYTDCYVKLFSPQGFMQGIGMESDEMARNAVLLNPFDGYAVLQEESDTTSESSSDSLNFIDTLVRR